MNAADTKKSDIILRAKDLTRIIETEAGSKTIIKAISYRFQRGKVYTFVGPSGSGKTSLLRLFNRLDEKTSGDVLFNDRPIEDYPVTQLRMKIALAFQVPYLFPGTVASNLAYCCGEKMAGDKEFSSHFLNMVGLEPEFAERDPEQLSVGQKQRVALARALVQEPDILLLDEPTSALDPGASRTIEELIVNLNRELQLTTIMVTHNFRQAQRLDGISLVLVDGNLIESGKSSELFANPKDDLTRRFVRGELR